MNIKKMVEDIFDTAAEPAVDVVSALFLEGFAGQILPGVTSAMLAYKQKRSEKMLERFMLETRTRQDALEQRLLEAGPDRIDEISSKYFGIVTDYVIDEVQEEKIRYIVNGFINLASLDTVQEDFVLTYYDTLKALRVRDIGVLHYYYGLTHGAPGKSYMGIMDELGLEQDQYNAIREKLARHGLLTTRREANEDYLYANIASIQEYLLTLAKGKAAKLKSFKRIDKRDSYIISRFGRDFIRFFIDTAI